MRADKDRNSRRSGQLATVQDLADALILAEIVWDLYDLGAFPPQLSADLEDRKQCEVAVAYFVRGV